MASGRSVTRLRWYSSAPPVHRASSSSRGSSPRLTGTAPSLSSSCSRCRGCSPVAAARVRFDTDVLSLLPHVWQHDSRVPPLRDRASAASTTSTSSSLRPTVAASPTTTPTSMTWIDRAARGTGDRRGGHRHRRRLAKFRLARRSPAAAAAMAKRSKKASNRLTPDGLLQAVASQRELLALPSSRVADLRAAGSRRPVRDRLRIFSDRRHGRFHPADTRVSSARTDAVGSSSPDRRVRPTKPSSRGRWTRACMRFAQQCFTLRRATIPTSLSSPPPLEVAFAGGHRIALETEAAVRRESIWSTVGSLAAILPLLFILFRSLWLVLVGPLPSVLSLVVVGGVLGLAGVTLSAAMAGSAAMLFGLGVDGVVLLYVTHRLASRAGATEAERISAIAESSSSMLLGMWTTAATFYGLAFVDVPSLQQLGLLIGHCMVVCSILTLVLVPALLPRTSATTRRVLTMPRFSRWIAVRRRAILGVAAVLTVGLAGASTRLQIDPTLDRLRSVTPAAQLEEQVAPIFGLPRDVYILFAEGASLDPLLAHGRAGRRPAGARAARRTSTARLTPAAQPRGPECLGRTHCERVAVTGHRPRGARPGGRRCGFPRRCVPAVRRSAAAPAGYVLPRHLRRVRGERSE